ncbi:SPOR domain-containing protein [Limnovirga soli]|uniref:SPOR domain-containing protein n=1 Tax=Limnovirga soli TaxID=2656915 RepID=A0A8J8FI68_9BACT|nr:SPOR domain-containing protein [Limnovirga soli]NNV57067.1 hypothetical protein [Limnovirga soli]
MIKAILFCSFAFIYTNSLFAARDTVIVHQDSRLEIFTQKEAAVNKITAQMTSTGKFRGYRLQVLNTRNRELAFKTKADLLRLFPSQKTYISFQAPNFKVRIGNFLKKPDAVAFQKQFAKAYNQNAYIVEDVIDYVLKDDDDGATNQ